MNENEELFSELRDKIDLHHWGRWQGNGLGPLWELREEERPFQTILGSWADLEDDELPDISEFTSVKETTTCTISSVAEESDRESGLLSPKYPLGQNIPNHITLRTWASFEDDDSLPELPVFATPLKLEQPPIALPNTTPLEDVLGASEIMNASISDIAVGRLASQNVESRDEEVTFGAVRNISCIYLPKY